MTFSTIDETMIDERKFVVALARGLDLLRAFRPGETMLGNRDFAERTGLPRRHRLGFRSSGRDRGRGRRPPERNPIQSDRISLKTS